MAAIAPCPAGTACCMREAASAYGADGVAEGERAGYYVGRIFSEGVAGGEGRRDAFFGEDAGGGDGDGENRRLGVLGELEVVFRTFEDEGGEREAESGIGFFEGGSGDGECIVEGAAHAYILRALAGEEECWLDHR